MSCFPYYPEDSNEYHGLHGGGELEIYLKRFLQFTKVIDPAKFVNASESYRSEDMT